MKRVDALLGDYASSHQTRGNLACHAAGITLIVFGVLSLLATVPIARGLTASEALIGVAFVAYASLDLPLALGVLVFAGVLDFAARSVADWRAGVCAFVAGWIFQAVGHAVYEKNKPAFFRNLAHLLVGPAYLVAESLGLRRGPARPPD
jgi:uncharacterized membrane protein YGL010W